MGIEWVTSHMILHHVFNTMEEHGVKKKKLYTGRSESTILKHYQKERRRKSKRRGRRKKIK